MMGAARAGSDFHRLSTRSAARRIGVSGILELVREALRDILPGVDLLLSQLVRPRALDLSEHSIEGGDEPASLVAGLHDEPHAEVAGRDAARRLLEAYEGLGDEVRGRPAEEDGE